MEFDASRYVKPVLWGLQALLLTLGAYFLVKAIIFFTTPQSVWVAPASVQSREAAPLTPRIILPPGFDPFSRDSVARVTVERGQSAPETTLSLTLVARRFGAEGTAVIRLTDGTQKLVREGEEIMSGVILDSVHEDYVLIKQGGRLERLSFEKDPTGLRTEADETASSSVDITVSGDASTVDGIEITGQGSDQLSVRTQFPLSMAADLLDFTEVRQDGRRQGYQVEIANGQIDLTEIGLRPDDVITRINDEDLTIGNPEMDAILAEAINADKLEFDILRNGRTITISVKGP